MPRSDKMTDMKPMHDPRISLRAFSLSVDTSSYAVSRSGTERDTYSDICVGNVAHNILVVVQNRQRRDGLIVDHLQGRGEGLVAAALVSAADSRGWLT
jgi:hypothetical protein